jgi:DNA-binding CsgD family transcriptional regulator/tetratricopeptide (TPR) repeat protein
MQLVEREELLAGLGGLLEDARGGQGRLALVGGEAGVGKTSLVHALVDGLPGGVRVLLGACDPLSTPRPLAPFRDMAAADDSVARVLSGRPARHAVLSGLLGELSVTTVLVVDDAHWADEATLDALRFLGRRVHRTRGLVVVTFRDDETPAGHPLRAVLGDLVTAPGCRRVTVPPLTLDGVAALAVGHAYEPQRLHRVTGGNPFYVTEVLAAPAWVLPQTVSDAVLARTRRLSEDARRLLWTVSLSPGGLELSLAGGTDQGHDECLGAGMLHYAGDRLSFRHELARQAVEASIPAPTRQRLHRRLLTALEGGGEEDPARLAHHAEAAGEEERTRRYSVQAAREASFRGAHREAARQYERAAANAGALGPGEHADLLLAWSVELVSFDADRIVPLRRRVLALRREAGDAVGEAAAKEWLSAALWGEGRTVESAALAEEAVTSLEALPPGPELAEAYSWLARIAMLANRAEEAERWARKAIELSERVGDRSAQMNGLIALGATEITNHERLEGLVLLDRAAEVALELGNDTAHSRVLDNAGSALARLRRYDLALPYFERSLAFASERDLDVSIGYSTAWLARVRFEQGDWDEAEALVAGQVPHEHVHVRIALRLVQGRLASRRGQPEAAGLLDDAWELAVVIGEIQRLGPVAAGRAELAWLAGRPEAIASLVGETFELARARGQRWAVGELGFWLWRAGVLRDAPADAAEPFALQIDGDWQGAAAAWERIGCPYERAEALADGDEAAQRTALEIFTRLGAEPAADRLRAELRRSGVAGVPPRPRAATRDAPAQLTARQLEVLRLVAAGQTNAEIAGRLFITEKTAGHHVSAVLRKLGARSRTEAAAAAHRLGIGPLDR